MCSSISVQFNDDFLNIKENYSSLANCSSYPVVNCGVTHLAANSPYLQNAVSRPPTRTIRTFPNTPGFCEGVCCLCLTSNGDIGADIDVDVVDDVEGGEPKGGEEDTGGGEEEDILESTGVQLQRLELRGCALQCA